MESVKTVALLYFAALLLVVLVSTTDAQKHQRPLCSSQLSLVNNACVNLPFMSITPPSPNPSSPPPPSPTAPLPPSHVYQRRHRGGHRAGRHRHHGSPAEENCCRWLKELDTECVCNVLVRLPPFLAKPAHQFTVLVNNACNVTYSCSGRIIP